MDKRRYARWIAFALLGIVGLLATVPLAISYSPGLRTRVLEAITQRVERNNGVYATARDFRIDWWSVRAQIFDLHVAASSDDPPLLTVAEVEARIRPSSFPTGPWSIETAAIRRPTLDLLAPVPRNRSQTPTDSQDPSSGLLQTLVVSQFRVTEGTVIPPDTLAEGSWLEAWGLEALGASGSIDAGTLRVESGTGRVRLQRRDAPELLWEVDTRAHGSLLGPYAVDRLTVRGPGVDVSASGRVGVSRGSDRDVTFALTADPREIIPGLTVGGPVQASGALDLRAWTGQAQLEADGFPAEVVEPWVGPQAMQRLRIAGSVLDLDADLELDPTIFGQVDAQLTADWRRGTQPLLNAEAEVQDLQVAEGLDIPRLLDPAVVRGVVRVSGDDLPAGLLDPWILPLLPRPGVDPSIFTADARLAIDVDYAFDPSDGTRGRGEVLWRQGPEARLSLDAVSSGGRLDLDDLRPATTQIAVRGERLPERFALLWLDPSLQDTLGGEAGVLDLDATVDLSMSAGGSFPRIDAGGSTSWRRPDQDSNGEAVLLRTEFRTAERDADQGQGSAGQGQGQGQAGLRTTSELLPDAPGAHRIAVDLWAVDLLGLADPRTIDARVDLDSIHIPSTTEALRRHWPNLLPEGVEGWVSEGPTADHTLTAGAELELENGANAPTLHLDHFEASLGDFRVEGHGTSNPNDPWGDTRLAMDATLLEDQVHLDARLTGGALQLEVPSVITSRGRGLVDVTVPLGTLRPWLGDGDPPAWPADALGGPVAVEFHLADLVLPDEFLKESEAWDALDLPQGLPPIFGEAFLDLENPARSKGRVTVGATAGTWQIHPVQIPEALDLRIADQRLTLEPFRMTVGGRALDISLAADLDPLWRPEDPVDQLVTHLDILAQGALEAVLLQPYLAGVEATGVFRGDLTLRGPPTQLDGRLQVQGDDVRLVTLSPYFTRLDQPSLSLDIVDGDMFLREAKAQVNQGTVTVSGRHIQGGPTTLTTRLQAVRYRVDYGLGTELSGQLDLTLPPQWPDRSAGQGRLAGRITVDQGLLRQDVQVEREIFETLLAPAVAATPDPDDLLDTIDLDLQIATAEGVRMKNNVADLRVTWSPLVVRGTAREPSIDGRLDVVPGGFFYLYGQTARVEQATVDLERYPVLPPQLRFDITTSLDDPSLAREGAGRFPTTASSQGAAPTDEQRQALLTAGLASYWADQLVGQVDLLGGARISVAPLLIFGETDPGARLTVSRDLSSQVSVAVSADLRSEGRQIYLLDLHDFSPFPSFTAQLFTNDQQNYGATLQQTLELGGTQTEEPKIRELRIDGPEGFELEKPQDATGLKSGDRMPPGSDFDLEVEVLEHLRAKGYPGAEVTVSSTPLEDGRVDVAVGIVPGPRVAIEFTGNDLPRSARRTIRRLYRADFYEPAALREMHASAVQTLRGQGYPEPTVDITLDDQAQDVDRRVIVHIERGEKRSIPAVEFRGVPEGVAARLASNVSGQLQRQDLALGDPAADRRLLGLLRGLGYPEPRLVDRRLMDDKRLVVDLEPGPRQRIGTVEVEGLSEELATDLRASLEIRSGDPASAQRIATGLVALEQSLRERGHLDARAESFLGESAFGDGVILTYRVEPGPRYRVEDVRFNGLQGTRQRWAERMAQIFDDSWADPDGLAEARRRLFGSGVFRSVVPDFERLPGAEDGPTGDVLAMFDVEERPRFQVSYGLRWESSTGIGVVADAVDRNAFGRGVSLGVRGQWGERDSSARAYSAFPRIFGTRADLEIFAEGSEEEIEGDLGSRTLRQAEGTFQVSWPLEWSSKGKTTTRLYYRHRENRTLTSPDDGPSEVVRSRTPVFGWQVLFDSRDDSINATRGMLLSFDLTGSEEFMGTDSSFLRLFSRANVHRRLGTWRGDSLVWAQSWRLGVAEALDDNPLDEAERFFAGGEFSVRGYREDTLGQPVDRLLGLPVGGESLLVVNQELHVPLPWESLQAWGVRGLVFLDAGNVWADADDLGFDLETAVGWGLRASTPVGWLRFDMGFPLNRRPVDEDFELYFGFGNTF